MTSAFRAWIAPLYLFSCLVLGGSSLGIWNNAFLQVTAIVIIGWACIQPHRPGRARMPRTLTILIATLVLLILVQLIPLPSGLWQMLPGRAIIVEGDALLGAINASRPISMSPPDSWETLPTLLPPIAMLLAVTILGSVSGRRIAAMVAIAAVANLMLGLLQIGAGADGSGWYIYPRTNVGVPTGFFANGNHLAALLLCVLPLSAAVVQQLYTRTIDRQRRWAIIGASVASASLAVAGLMLNGSLFGLAMLAPVALASLLVAFRHSIGRRGRLALALASALVMIGGIALVADKSASIEPHGAAASLSTRIELAERASTAFIRFFPAGSGAGTFEQVYPMFEDPSAVDRFFINHVHNDYLEWAVEGGLPGVILLAIFLWWWGRSLITMLRDHRATGYAQACGIIGVILLAHSLVDFPLRTPALAAMFAVATGMMTSSRILPRQRPDLRPTRHLTIP